MKEGRHKRLHIEWLHVHEVSRKGKSIETRKQVIDCLGPGVGTGINYKVS